MGKIYKCKFCGKTFDEEKARNHIWYHIFRPSTICEKDGISNLRIVRGGRIFYWIRCKLCGNVFTEATSFRDPLLRKSLEKHVLGHHEWQDFFEISKEVV